MARSLFLAFLQRSTNDLGRAERRKARRQKMRDPIRSKHCARFLVVSVLVFFSSPAMAEDESSPWLARGRSAWGVGTTFGAADGDRAGQSGSIGVDVSRILTNTVGPGKLRGRSAVVVELLPLFVLSQDSPTYAVGLNLLGRHYLEAGGRMKPFITLGAGVVASAREIPEGAANLNFTPQIGAGFLFPGHGPHTYSIELRFHHLSNGGRAEFNPGINSVVVRFAVLFGGRQDAIQ
jgi:Lipid A 3-O-deacylase (PagL)